MRSSWRIETMVLPEHIEQNSEGQSFLILSNRSRVWPVSHLYHHWDENGCQWNALASCVDYRYKSIKERLKRLCSKPYSYFTSYIPYYPHSFVSTNFSDLLNYVPQTQTSYLDNKLARLLWGTGELSMVRASPKKLCEKYDNQTQPIKGKVKSAYEPSGPSCWSLSSNSPY